MDYELLEEIEELMVNEKYQDAVNVINSLDDDEMTVQLSILLAHAYSCLEQNHTAVEILKDIADEVDDEDIAYHFELASCYYGMHKYNSAVTEAEKCLDIDEEFVDAWLLLCYIYMDKNDEENFEYASMKAKEIDADAWETFFGTDGADDEIPMYSKKEINCVIKHIEKYFGKIDKMLKSDLQISMPIITAVIEPTKEKNYYTLVTVGIGAYRENVPQEMNALRLNRVELVAYLPPDWNIDSNDINDSWVNKYMQLLGNMTYYEDTWLGFGHTVSNGKPFADNTDFNGVILDNLHNVDMNASECELPDGDIVNFYQFIPLYEEEMMYKIKNDWGYLLARLQKSEGENYIGIIDINRPNVCTDMKEKKWAIPRSSIENVLEWNGADGCFATDRIMVDNKKVGYMYREKPDNEYDSGWRFLAGDESQEYMDNPENVGIYSLNTLCNYDIDINDYLEYPVGTAFYRDKNGKFVQDKNFRKN
ncbi:MAG: DUF2185 domain-containing protein [Clostridia bacterium]|nr:DUF2185 domain-containing protein [Clostridia bacterium]